jgi:hypothetical protein
MDPEEDAAAQEAQQETERQQLEASLQARLYTIEGEN